jgi:hypothetical protein
MKRGEILIPAGVDIWPHEMSTAQALAAAGKDIEFIKPAKRHHAKSPDILMDGLMWEIKSPKTDKLTSIERNHKRASKQADCIIIDSRRVHKLKDASIQTFLVAKLRQQKTIKKVIFVNRKRQLIDISDLIR